MHVSEAVAGRRRVLSATVGFVAGAGIVGLAIPFVAAWRPSARAKAVGSAVEINVKKIEPGAMVTVEWQGKPVFILRRTPNQLSVLSSPAHAAKLRDPDSSVNNQPDYVKNNHRSIRPEIFVCVGVCTHLGCVPEYKKTGLQEDNDALYFCPCHGSKFDMAGRVYKGVPAPTNLIVPPHHYIENTILVIGSSENV
ncbi:ubiquinol-cytochrome c reductase iron-sulfur subunit [Teredinibacter turnerae]|uniref:ubiquinol-cytochrome c reductase iron-sulfur subunit n=1 Tax=Teredinibacter turnerae TaxID=2426 RepID=UPI00036E3456|nr:ubiquinol-cytochrome c reductase iron-sulfur subunit [Teredinibacter turnerae]